MLRAVVSKVRAIEINVSPGTTSYARNDGTGVGVGATNDGEGVGPAGVGTGGAAPALAADPPGRTASGTHAPAATATERSSAVISRARIGASLTADPARRLRRRRSGTEP